MPELKAKQDWYPLTAESRKSPAARLGGPSTVCRRNRAARRPWFPENAGTRQTPPQARSPAPLSCPGGLSATSGRGPAPRQNQAPQPGRPRWGASASKSTSGRLITGPDRSGRVSRVAGMLQAGGDSVGEVVERLQNSDLRMAQLATVPRIFAVAGSWKERPTPHLDALVCR